MVNILFAAKSFRWQEYEAPLRTAMERVGLKANLTTQADPADVDYIIYAPNSEVQDFAPFTRLKAVLNLWAGVEDVEGNLTLPLSVPLTRMVDSGLTEGMVEWVTGHVLRHHLGMDTHVSGQDGLWREGSAPPLARNRPVTVLGLGVLGSACAQALAALNFPVTGWARSPRDIPNVRCEHGPDGMRRALADAQIVVLLLPHARSTENILNADAMTQLPRGAVIINPGRGPLIDDDALLAALDSGQIGHATLDVFRVEPLPAEHPFWTHPRITVTPHIASETRADTASQGIIENIHRAEQGQPLLHQVDRSEAMAFGRE